MQENIWPLRERQRNKVCSVWKKENVQVDDVMTTFQRNISGLLKLMKHLGQYGVGRFEVTHKKVRTAQSCSRLPRKEISFSGKISDWGRPPPLIFMRIYSLDRKQRAVNCVAFEVLLSLQLDLKPPLVRGNLIQQHWKPRSQSAPY